MTQPNGETSALEALWAVVRRIPRGRVAGYGQVGSASERPVSGFLAGKWLGHCPADLPWWRVVGKTGELLIAKRSPELALRQRELLEAEGVAFTPDGRVVHQAFVADEDFLDPDPLGEA